ncbi:MAG: TlpA disulfide reductase family protein [Gemmobacter sp.]|nr:TlpA disulfide reductase family protein [Gemmobacter sp.]
MGGLSGLKGLVGLTAVYTALAFGANPAAADAALTALRQGEMRKLVVHDAPVAAGTAVFTARDGTEHRLSDWQGKVVVLNFWATWCPPCRAEMPALDALAEAMAPDVEVVTVATGRNMPAAIDKFFADAGIVRLPILLDPKSALAREMGVVGLPVTVVLDREGREVARMIGEADWMTAEARAMLAAVAAR